MNHTHKKPLPGTTVHYIDARAAVDVLSPGAWARLPYTARVHAENLVRRADPAQLDSYLLQLIERLRDIDFPWYPVRVVCHDILGQTALVDLAGLRDAIAAEGGDPAQVNPVVPVQLIVDHSLAVECGGFDPDAFAKNRAIEDRRNEDRFHFIEWTKKAFANVDVIPAGNGIMHQINLEKMSPVVTVQDGLAFPDTCVGTDSHTPHVDALGVIAVGVGGLEAENVMLGRACWMRMPEIVGVRLTGRRQGGITATDIVLALTEFLRQQKVVGAYVEFFGEGADSLSIGDRATISNMCPEYGATAAMFSIDDQTLAYLRLTGRDEAQVRLVEAYARTAGFWSDSLADAQYERVLQFDLSTVVRNMAGPSNPHRRLPTSALAERGIADAAKLQAARAQESQGLMPDGAVIIAAITSCTNTSNPRNVIAAALLARNANRLGLTRKPWVKTSLAPGSKAVELYLKEAGLLTELEQLGFGIVAFACTTCNGMSGALDPAIQQEIIERDLYATAVLSGNRNFDGRIHPQAKQAFLASPPLVVAYAIAGDMNIDLTTQPLAHTPEGQPVFLKDIWPTSKEVAELVESIVTREMFQQKYADVFRGDARWQAVEVTDSETYDWPPSSTYIRNPPYFQGMGPQKGRIHNIDGARILALLGDMITTDHISPAGSFKPTTPAGKYLTEHQVAPRDFNSYGSRRGNHEVMMRGTFANIRIRNEMLEGVEGGYSKGPDGQQTSIYDAAMAYKDAGIPLVVIGGIEYGAGSSRDWAAKGTNLLGVKAVIAESFERIHRSNLVGMGVIPFEFTGGDNRKSLGLTGDEVISIDGLEGDFKPLSLVPATIRYADGTVKVIQLKARVDTEVEIEYLENGGVLHYVLRNLAKA